MDPNMKKEYKGTDGTVGFVYAWDGNDKAGKGEQEITRIEEGKRIDMALRFKKPFESNAAAYMATEPVKPGETLVRWQMSGKSPYPMNFMNLFMDNLLGKDLQSSLTMLKNNLEQKQLSENIN